jgi:hypothetical protein
MLSGKISLARDFRRTILQDNVHCGMHCIADSNLTYIFNKIIKPCVYAIAFVT